MESFTSFEESLYHVNDQSFEEIALKLFQFQAKGNPVYAEYIQHLGVQPNSVRSIRDIPYLPVSFFKTHDIKTDQWHERTVFTSSGTTGMTSARHLVYDPDFYLRNTVKCFELFYGDPSNYRFLVMLPSYAERQGSSLIAMIEHFMKLGGGASYHNNTSGLLDQLGRKQDKKVILWGVTFALADLAEQHELDLSNCIVFETGGMKGRRKEITRAELHELLGRRFHTKIHSEYGMTELMSQAYSMGNGIFQCPPWMKIVIRDPEDPRDLSEGRERGGINIIDLANIHTCAFIETQDLGKVGQKGSFEVLGRMDNSDIRGCNLLVE
ncbi:MAG: acyl transferase [Bacteroidota bacterium]